jgi:GTPase SAR1 family protein
MIYPFKLLDAYLEKDKEIFFGRQEEIDLLYEMVFQTNVLLVYGASGTGKTSLIQCGLAGKFQAHDWLALNIRRGTNINHSFERAISEAAGTNGNSRELIHNEAGSENINPLEKYFRAIYLNNFRPIYLIFDQLEEIYILGDKEEQDRFIKTVKNILTVEQPVKIIFSIREEYLAFLYEFEKSVPQLLRKKLRIEKMNLDKVRQVITGISASKKTNILLNVQEIEPFVANLFNKVRGREQTLTIQLPYLQVYLDKLYLHITNDESRKAKATFSPEALLAFGGIDDVLKDFLDDQVQIVTKILWDNRRIQVTRENIWSILWPFVTMEGTKAPTSMASIQNRLHGELPEKTVEEAVSALVSRRVLRYLENDNLFEIAHDSLGSEIANNRSPEQSRILESERIIKSRFSPDLSRQDYLNPWQLEYIKPVRHKLKITEEQRRFVEQSIKKARRRILTKRAIIISVIVGLCVVSLILNIAKNNAQNANKLAKVAITQAKKATADAVRSQQQADSALKEQKIASENERLARLSADSATHEAQKYAESLAISQLAADLSAQQAGRDRDSAKAYAAIADSSRHVADQQKHTADSLRTAEFVNKNITQSIQFALESILSEKPYEKISLATRSYDLNAEYNNNEWNPQITEALAKAVPLTSMQRVLSLFSSVLDIIPMTGSAVMIITDAGEIRSFDLETKGPGKILWQDTRLHYVNNSGYFDKQKSQLVIRDMDNMEYVFSINNSTAELIQKHPSVNEKSSLIFRESLVLSSKELRTRGGEGNNLIFSFNKNFGSTFELSADKNVVAAGTTNGWLYLSEYPVIQGKRFEGLYQTQNSRVNDIAIDKQGLFFATGGADSRLRLTTTKLVEKVPLEYRFNSWVNSVLFLGNMKLIIGTAEGKIYLLNFDQDQLVESCRKAIRDVSRGIK